MVQYFEPLPSRKLQLGGQQVQVSLGTGAFICKGARPIRALELKVGPQATSGFPHVLIMCWQWLLLLGWLSRALRFYPESREPAEVSGRGERRAGGSCLGDTSNPRSQQELPSGRDSSFGFTARGDPSVPGDALPSPALETDSGPAMEEREPPPRCAAREGTGQGKVLGAGDSEQLQGDGGCSGDRQGDCSAEFGECCAC